MKKIVCLTVIFLMFAFQTYAATINATTASTEPVSSSKNIVTFTGSSVPAGVTQVFRLDFVTAVSRGDILAIGFDGAGDNCTIKLFSSEALANADSIPDISFNKTTRYYSPEILPRAFATREVNPNQYKMYLRVRNGSSVAIGAWTCPITIGSN